MRPTTLLSLLALSFGTQACGGDSGPNYTLKMVMLEVELERADMEKALLRDGGSADVLKSALAIERWHKDPAVGRYLERSDIKGTPAQFEGMEAMFQEKLGAMITAAEAGDEEAARSFSWNIASMPSNCAGVPLMSERSR